ncbi:tRNA (N6-threonylcarbamoyladenosine(37)-N6)-methyltransferase TrmO [Alkalimonas collagenimarina]|uniref:tRNA (N6-threonylcarbamoyladenosine(37)-N6)-methyltransferase TrmO n=1 Tax=Alkalimonas collagenimarina TaxID=400390 RepID=A0ABT9H328_9GAMM|nr:tRNA (N6-threonylcarbamoyladenosine(37)-N6)-methyltransferase TrmO [Alkalimonas collagenimarina]MDP4537726.1 tRNA (N6-threonylcarbamoyladenosine(37)-N6)-methyltransferase TrmO [Alkalimonas collagenimarina]
MQNTFEFEAIGYIRSPYKQKFAIPRQPGLIPEAKAQLVFHDSFSAEPFIRGIEEFSHLWLLFVFHETADKGWSPMVRPPRLGGNIRKGVFATRATFRPNPIGLSVVQLEGVRITGKQVELDLAGIDLVDGTPIIDIKPYLPYSDAIPDAKASFADSAPETGMTVSFSEQAELFCQSQPQYPQLQLFIEKVLKQDPRPPYKKKHSGEQSYGMTLYTFNIQWTVTGEHHYVYAITPLP